ncbi:MAG: hypothetical protein LQ337_004766 [Flavoplaca oasis]|nr:MAG: hypothetical protein LQ337_004766 [Flavoplaca oasis]
MLLSYTFSYILALLISATYLPTIRAVPFPKNILIPALAASNDLQQVRHHAPTADIPGRLTSRAGGPGNQVGHPASLMHMMTTVPGSFRNLVTIVPVEEAAAALKNFFLSVYEAGLTSQSSRPRQAAITFQSHGFTMMITALGDTIPWEFVQRFAVNGWQFAARGFTDLFDIMYQNADGTILVNVSLRLLNQALTEPASGSGDSAQTAEDWREGSVPSVGSGADANVNNMENFNWGGMR